MSTRSKGVGYGRKGIARAPCLVGARFGHLEVLARVSPPTSGRNVLWDCRCECGEVITARGDRLRSGRTWRCERGCTAAIAIADNPLGLARHEAQPPA